ncbi:hypothetical protein ACFY7Z_25995 [Streptomyces sp. NPDC012623]|uniref:hypothetical protein n=1 Tax=unclassified Streptomyces TaxID=2593676 RepID=UPI003689EF48
MSADSRRALDDAMTGTAISRARTSAMVLGRRTMKFLPTGGEGHYFRRTGSCG